MTSLPPGHLSVEEFNAVKARATRTGTTFNTALIQRHREIEIEGREIRHGDPMPVASLTPAEFYGAVSGRDKAASAKLALLIERRTFRDRSMTAQQHVTAIKSEVERTSVENARRSSETPRHTRSLPAPGLRETEAPIEPATASPHRLRGLVASVAPDASGGLATVSLDLAAKIESAAVDYDKSAGGGAAKRLVAALIDTREEPQYGAHYLAYTLMKIDDLIAASDDAPEAA